MRNVFTNTLLLLFSLTLSIILAEVLFSVYEGISSLISIDSEIVYLEALDYNDTFVSRSQDTNAYRILSFGDTFGYTITKYPYFYHAVAAKILNTPQSPQIVRIVNLGVASTSFYQYIRLYKYWSTIIEHDAVVFNVYLGNDIIDVTSGYTPDTTEVRGIFENVQESIQINKIPRKYPLRMMDHIYAHYLTLVI